MELRMPADTDQTKSTAEDKLGKVIFYLLKEKYLTKEKINYAKRIQKKLQPPKPLLEVLKELEYVDVSTVKATAIQPTACSLIP